MLTDTQALTLRNDILARAGAGGALESLWSQGADGAIAEWYNAPAQSGEFGTPLLVWNPSMSIDQINAAIVWTQKPTGADNTEKMLNCLIWQNMIWANHIDMTDTQVRQGIDDLWGAGSTNANNLKAAGRRTGTRFELVFAGGGVGGARVSSMFNATCSDDDIAQARALGG